MAIEQDTIGQLAFRASDVVELQSIPPRYGYEHAATEMIPVQILISLLQSSIA